MYLKRHGYIILVLSVINEKEAYCIERKTFDKLNSECKRQYHLQQQQHIEEKLNNIVQRDFWKLIGKIGIAKDRKRAIPLAVVDNNDRVTNEQADVLNKWKSDFESLFRCNEERNKQFERTFFDMDIIVNI